VYFDMKNSLLITSFAGFVFCGSAFAQDHSNTVSVYKCVNSIGKSGVGTGRLSLENEYSPFLKKHVRAGEFVIFRYENRGKEYWFKASNCSKA